MGGCRLTKGGLYPWNLSVTTWKENVNGIFSKGSQAFEEKLD